MSGDSHTLDTLLWSYVTFFVVLFFLINYAGFGEYVTAGELPTPQQQTGWDLLNPFTQASYFFSVMFFNFELGIFTILISIPFGFLFAVWLARWARGN